MEFIWTLLVGGLAGWLAGLIMRGDGFGMLQNIILGVAGGLVGSWALRLFGLESEYYLVTAFLGALLILWLARVLRR